MKIVSIKIDLVMEDENCESTESICDYLNSQLYENPEFFGTLDGSNIISVTDYL